MQAENSKDTKNKELPSVRFFIESSPKGLAVGFDPEQPITVVDLISLLSAGVWGLTACVAGEIGADKDDVWEMIKISVGIIQETMPEMGNITERGDNESDNN